MEHLALEIFNIGDSTSSQYAVLPEDASITITDTSEIFASGDVWSHSFTLNVFANAHIFGTSGEVHGSRLHEQIHKRKARLWVEGTPLYLGYLMLDDEVEVDGEGNVEVTFESGTKTFDKRIEGTKAREVSVGDVPIGVALNRKREAVFQGGTVAFTLNNLSAYAAKEDWLEGVDGITFFQSFPAITTPYVQRWPKMVKSHGTVYTVSNGQWTEETHDYTNVQTPYDAGHPFCNINICYPFKANKLGEEVASRGYTTRLAHGKPTTDGGDGETRYNNAPNFYLLYFIDRLFKDLGIHIEENQALEVEDLRRVFMLNYGCHYEEIEDTYNDYPIHSTPDDKLSRYGQYYIPIVDEDGKRYLVNKWTNAGSTLKVDESIPGKILLRNVTVRKDGHVGDLHVGAVEGQVLGRKETDYSYGGTFYAYINATQDEFAHNAYSAYTAYATGDNYPDVEIREIVDAMKTMFGIRLLFNNDFSTVRIVLLRNIFKNPEVQDIACDIIDEKKVENSKRGFRLTYGKGTEDTQFYYKGFNDMFPRAATTWKDTSDRHDYSQWELNAEYGNVKQSASSMNRTCYVTPVNGNAYVTKVDEEEDVLFPSIIEVGAFMDAEDGDCSGESETIEEVRINASPVIMNDVDGTYASLFTGDMKAPSPDDPLYSQKIATFGRVSIGRDIDFSQSAAKDGSNFTVSGILDVYLSEGFKIRMMDCYAISNGGTPFDEADAGLQFGIMRSSGSDAHVRYFDDVDDHESNDTWEIEPGTSAVVHSDTCDGYGEEWDYDGSMHVSVSEAESKLEELFPSSDAPFYDGAKGYITATELFYSKDGKKVLVASAYSISGETISHSGDIRYWVQLTLEEIQEVSRSGRHMFIEADSSWERGSTLVQLCEMAYDFDRPGNYAMVIDNGVGSRYGRFSLKLRAEKLNPYYDPKQVESSYNRRYLPISNEDLRKRGIADKFYKEYSYWIRNARIASRTVPMELAQLRTIDKTKRVHVGDITGFILKMQYTVSNKTGLGNVTMEIMYI